MTTLYGKWEGTGSGKGRIRVEYTRSYNSDHTQARYTGSVYLEGDTSLTDTSNAWKVQSPDFADGSGSNVSYSFPSGGGKKKIFDFDYYKAGNGVITNAEVSGIDYYGETVNDDFTLDSGALAPYLNNSNYTVNTITSSSFRSTGISGNGNGGTLNNVQMEVNTTPSDSGALYFIANAYADVTASGLYRATTYWYRIRICNTTYGWSAWGAWKSVVTLSTVPSQPLTSWTIDNITQTDAVASGFAVSDNGGSALDMWLVRLNTAPQETSGYVDFTGGGGVTSLPITGLIPGTTYYAKLWVHNVNGWNADPTWKSFVALPGVSVNVGGVWKNAQPFVNVGGVWKPAVRYVNVGGVWKQ